MKFGLLIYFMNFFGRFTASQNSPLSRISVVGDGLKQATNEGGIVQANSLRGSRHLAVEDVFVDTTPTATTTTTNNKIRRMMKKKKKLATAATSDNNNVNRDGDRKNRRKKRKKITTTATTATEAVTSEQTITIATVSATTSRSNEDNVDNGASLSTPDEETAGKKNAEPPEDSKFTNDSCGPDNATIIFGGITTAWSAQRGTIQVSWEAASLVSSYIDLSSCDDLRYHVFVAESPYDFSEISLFQIFHGGTMNRYETTDTTVTLSNGLADGIMYDLLVVAEVGTSGTFVSLNREPKSIRVATEDPVIRSDVKRVKSPPVRAERIADTTIKFPIIDRKTKIMAKRFEVDDWVVGEYLNGEPFLVKLVAPLDEDDKSAATWEVQDGSIADIFSRLTFDASVDTNSMYSTKNHVTADGRRLINVAPSFQETELLAMKMSMPFEVGMASGTFDSDFKQVANISVDIERSGFRLEKFDIRVEVENTVRGSLKFDFRSGVEKKSEPSVEEIWKGQVVPRTFRIRSLPVPVAFTPRLFLVYQSHTNMDVAATGNLEYESTIKNIVTFNLENGWQATDSQSTVFDGAVDLGGSAILEASLALRFQLDIAIFDTIRLDQFSQIGPYLSIQGSSMPDVIQPQFPGFYFSELEMGGKTATGIKAKLDIPSTNEDGFREANPEIETVHEEAVLLLTLPSASFAVKSFDTCVGDDAIRMVVKTTEGPYSAQIANSIQSPTEFLPVLYKGVSSDLDWIVSPTSDHDVVLTLSRSAIGSREFYHLPVGRFYYQTRVAVPDNKIITALFTQEMDELSGVPDVENFDCCTDEDCTIKFKGQPFICETNQCKSVPKTKVPTASPTQAPSQSPTALPTQAPSQSPTALPTHVPTTALPTHAPTTALPTQVPTALPTQTPTTALPTQVPAVLPTYVPTRLLTHPPTSPSTTSPTPRQTEEEEEEDKYSAGSYGDPHLFTFDGLQYSCQAKGDFWLSRSLDSGMKVQGRFERLNMQATLTTGVVAQSSDKGPTVALLISDTRSRPTILIVNGVEQSGVQYEDATVRVYTRGNDQHTILFTDTGLQVDVDRIMSRFPHFSVNTKIPPSLFVNERVVGLLGTPNDNPLDDWTDANGITLPFSSADKDGFDYCTNNWCIRNEADSLFTYMETRNFAYYSGCDDPYVGDIDLSLASPANEKLCGLNAQCLVDGIQMDNEGAWHALAAQAVLVQAARGARFRFEPAAIRVGGPVDIKVTVNVKAHHHSTNAATDTEAIERFHLYHTDELGSSITSPLLATLVDTGDEGVDDMPNDGIFTTVMTVESTTAGQVFHFRAVPVVDGQENNSSADTSLNAVMSFSQSSGLGAVAWNQGSAVNQQLIIHEDSIDDLVLVIDYSWSDKQTDLDTSTTFLGSSVGYGCWPDGPWSSYLEFSGDSFGEGGTETARVRLGDAFGDGGVGRNGSNLDNGHKILNGITIEMHAGWYGVDNGVETIERGGASVSVYTERTSVDGVVTTGPAVSFAFVPGLQTGCADTDIGAAIVQVQDDGSVTIQVVSVQNDLI